MLLEGLEFLVIYLLEKYLQFLDIFLTNGLLTGFAYNSKFTARNRVVERKDLIPSPGWCLGASLEPETGGIGFLSSIFRWMIWRWPLSIGFFNYGFESIKLLFVVLFAFITLLNYTSRDVEHSFWQYKKNNPSVKIGSNRIYVKHNLDLFKFLVWMFFMLGVLE